MSTFRQPMLLLDRSLWETGKTPSVNADDRREGLENQDEVRFTLVPTRPEPRWGVHSTPVMQPPSSHWTRWLTLAGPNLEFVPLLPRKPLIAPTTTPRLRF